MKIESTRKKALHLARFESKTSKILAGNLTTALLQPLPKLNNILPSTLRTKESQTGSFFKVWTELEKKIRNNKNRLRPKSSDLTETPEKTIPIFFLPKQKKNFGLTFKKRFLAFSFFSFNRWRVSYELLRSVVQKSFFFSAGHRTPNVLVNHFLLSTGIGCITGSTKI